MAPWTVSRDDFNKAAENIILNYSNDEQGKILGKYFPVKVREGILDTSEKDFKFGLAMDLARLIALNSGRSSAGSYSLHRTAAARNTAYKMDSYHFLNAVPPEIVFLTLAVAKQKNSGTLPNAVEGMLQLIDARRGNGDLSGRVVSSAAEPVNDPVGTFLDANFKRETVGPVAELVGLAYSGSRFLVDVLSQIIRPQHATRVKIEGTANMRMTHLVTDMIEAANTPASKTGAFLNRITSAFWRFPVLKDIDRLVLSPEPLLISAAQKDVHVQTLSAALEEVKGDQRQLIDKLKEPNCARAWDELLRFVRAHGAPQDAEIAGEAIVLNGVSKINGSVFERRLQKEKEADRVKSVSTAENPWLREMDGDMTVDLSKIDDVMDYFKQARVMNWDSVHTTATEVQDPRYAIAREYLQNLHDVIKSGVVPPSLLRTLVHRLEDIDDNKVKNSTGEFLKSGLRQGTYTIALSELGDAYLQMYMGEADGLGTASHGSAARNNRLFDAFPILRIIFGLHSKRTFTAHELNEGRRYGSEGLMWESDRQLEKFRDYLWVLPFKLRGALKEMEKHSKRFVGQHEMIHPVLVGLKQVFHGQVVDVTKIDQVKEKLTAFKAETEDLESKPKLKAAIKTLEGELESHRLALSATDILFGRDLNIKQNAVFKAPKSGPAELRGLLLKDDKIGQAKRMVEKGGYAGIATHERNFAWDDILLTAAAWEKATGGNIKGTVLDLGHSNLREYKDTLDSRVVHFDPEKIAASFAVPTAQSWIERAKTSIGFLTWGIANGRLFDALELHEAVKAQRREEKVGRVYRGYVEDTKVPERVEDTQPVPRTESGYLKYQAQKALDKLSAIGTRGLAKLSGLEAEYLETKTAKKGEVLYQDKKYIVELQAPSREQMAVKAFGNLTGGGVKFAFAKYASQKIRGRWQASPDMKTAIINFAKEYAPLTAVGGVTSAAVDKVLDFGLMRRIPFVKQTLASPIALAGTQAILQVLNTGRINTDKLKSSLATVFGAKAIVRGSLYALKVARNMAKGMRTADAIAKAAVMVCTGGTGFVLDLAIEAIEWTVMSYGEDYATRHFASKALDEINQKQRQFAVRYNQNPSQISLEDVAGMTAELAELEQESQYLDDVKQKVIAMRTQLQTFWTQDRLAHLTSHMSHDMVA